VHVRIRCGTKPIHHFSNAEVIEPLDCSVNDRAIDSFDVTDFNEQSERLRYVIGLGYGAKSVFRTLMIALFSI
jgi:hypothetical protein